MPPQDESHSTVDYRTYRFPEQPPEAGSGHSGHRPQCMRTFQRHPQLIKITLLGAFCQTLDSAI